MTLATGWYNIISVDFVRSIGLQPSQIRPTLRPVVTMPWSARPPKVLIEELMGIDDEPPGYRISFDGVATVAEGNLLFTKEPEFSPATWNLKFKRESIHTDWWIMWADSEDPQQPFVWTIEQNKDYSQLILAPEGNREGQAFYLDRIKSE